MSSSLALKNPKTQIATELLITTSNKLSMGIIEAKIYMVKIENKASE
jgi:hypothetical protein